MLNMKPIKNHEFQKTVPSEIEIVLLATSWY